MHAAQHGPRATPTHPLPFGDARAALATPRNRKALKLGATAPAQVSIILTHGEGHEITNFSVPTDPLNTSRSMRR